tara:strand:+ start:3306 stop:3701 length:396 start_codon:yes stop_codon:yes gene_type:complete
MKMQEKLNSFCTLKRQKGASFLTIIVMLILVGLFLLTALKIAPAYLDNNVIVNAMEGIASNNDLATMSIAEVRESLQKTLITNSIRDFSMASVVLTREGNRNYIDINYESRVPLLYNIEIVVVFENRFDKN